MRYLVLFALLVVGCVNAQPALNSAAKAEDRIGGAAERALDAVAAAVSSVSDGVGPIEASVKLMIDALKARVEEPSRMPLYLGIYLGIMIVGLVAHAVAVWVLHRSHLKRIGLK